jgi:hypothetical protein
LPGTKEEIHHKVHKGARRKEISSKIHHRAHGVHGVF